MKCTLIVEFIKDAVIPSLHFYRKEVEKVLVNMGSINIKMKQLKNWLEQNFYTKNCCCILVTIATVVLMILIVIYAQPKPQSAHEGKIF